MKIKIDTSEFDELLLDVILQACADGNGDIDNMCLSTYEDACDYLTEKGYLQTTNGRIYKLVNTRTEVSGNSSHD